MSLKPPTTQKPWFWTSLYGTPKIAVIIAVMTDSLPSLNLLYQEPLPASPHQLLYFILVYIRQPRWSKYLPLHCRRPWHLDSWLQRFRTQNHLNILLPTFESQDSPCLEAELSEASPWQNTYRCVVFHWRSVEKFRRWTMVRVVGCEHTCCHWTVQLNTVKRLHFILCDFYHTTKRIF